MTILIRDLFKAQDIASIFIENCITFKMSYSNSNQSWIIHVENSNFYLEGLGNVQSFLNREGVEFYEQSNTN